MGSSLENWSSCLQGQGPGHGSLWPAWALQQGFLRDPHPLEGWGTGHSYSWGFWDEGVGRMCREGFPGGRGLAWELPLSRVRWWQVLSQAVLGWTGCSHTAHSPDLSLSLLFRAQWVFLVILAPLESPDLQ